MERPPLSTVLTSVLSAAVENTNRPALLATLSQDRPNVIPMQRRSPEQAEAGREPEPTPAA